MINKPHINAYDSSKTMWTIIELARNWKESKDINSGLASALIYANLAEFLSSGILSTIQMELNIRALKSKCRIIDEDKDQKRPNNLEYIISRLESYGFPKKDEIVPLLKKIKHSRNTLFHNLLTAHEKGIKRDSVIKSIQNDVEKLFVLWSDFHKELGI